MSRLSMSADHARPRTFGSAMPHAYEAQVCILCLVIAIGRTNIIIQSSAHRPRWSSPPPGLPPRRPALPLRSRAHSRARSPRQGCRCPRCIQVHQVPRGHLLCRLLQPGRQGVPCHRQILGESTVSIPFATSDTLEFCLPPPHFAPPLLSRPTAPASPLFALRRPSEASPDLLIRRSTFHCSILPTRLTQHITAPETLEDSPSS